VVAHGVDRAAGGTAKHEEGRHAHPPSLVQAAAAAPGARLESQVVYAR
jgi:hypothetical protein